LKKRADDVDSILKALEKNSYVLSPFGEALDSADLVNRPEDAEIARDGFKLKKRADDVDSILKELEKNS
jgi:hypothetical protein